MNFTFEGKKVEFILKTKVYMACFQNEFNIEALMGRWKM